MPKILCIVFICAGTLTAQTAIIDSLKKLGRDSLIKLAVQKLNEPEFDPGFYDIQKVKVSKTSLVVEFSASVRFFGHGDCFWNYVSQALAGSGTGRGGDGNCDNHKFYKLSASDKRKIDFVFESINKDNEIGDLPDKKLDAGTTMEIKERIDHYDVEVSGWSIYSHYKIQKISGKIYDAGHKHYDRSNDGPEEETEIK